MEAETNQTFLETKLLFFLKRLEKNSDIDAVTFDTDKNDFEMKKMDQRKSIAGRSISEILRRFDKKIKRSKILQ